MKIYYKGSNPNDNRRVKTGVESWDKNLFCSIYEKMAKAYGSCIEIIKVDLRANIITENTKEFTEHFRKQYKKESYFDWCVYVVEEAKRQGYDIVEFKR